MTNDYVYDIESYPNVFTCTVEHADAPIRWYFEISDWRNDSRALIDFLHRLAQYGCRMVGFNNVGFDYPVIHTLVRMGHGDAKTLYDKVQAIIGSQEDEDRWVHSVKPTDRLVPQIDLYKIHHFDNKARATSLKVLEFNMRMDNISDLPFPVGTILTRENVEVLKQYNAHDVAATKLFYRESIDAIHFRDEMCAIHPGKDWLNFSDVKLGVEFFIGRLEAAGVECYTYGPNGRQPRQTRRASIALNDAILPWIRFENPEFQRVLDWLRQQTITETKGVFKDLIARVGGIDFVFGLGGIHASVENEVLNASDTDDIIDIDVEGYYPSTAIAQGFRPAHFPEVFSEIYSGLKDERKKHAKGTVINKTLKLAGNGAYGNSNNEFSPLLDPMMTMQTTLNGQLLLCLLVEQLMKIPGLRMIQANTDGITVRCPKVATSHLHSVVSWWEGITRLKMEFSNYRTMCVRDVNNYIALYTSGKVKRIGAYEWKLERDGGRLRWDQNHSALVVPKVAEQVLLHGAPIRETVEQWGNLYDFMLRTKVPRSSHLLHGEDRVQNVSRYVVSRNGKQLTKVMPPLAKNPDVWRRIGVESGWNVTICNDVRDVAGAQIEFDYYIREVEKLVNGLA